MCPMCKSEETRVIDSRFVREQHAIRRRRQCNSCDKRFTTYERAELSLPMVVKRSGIREQFNRDKLRDGVRLACRKRAVPADEIDALIGAVEHDLAQSSEREMSSHDIGERVLARLRFLDEVAYVRFASVYREFTDVKQFLTALKRLQEPVGDD